MTIADPGSGTSIPNGTNIPNKVSDPFFVDTKCWVPEKEKGWVSATITERNPTDADDKVELVLVEDEYQEEPKIHRIIAKKTDLSENKDSFWAPLRNPSILESLDDLTFLSYLNEPSVLHSIKCRYSQLQIYTYSGIVLIAVNPFQSMPSLYSHEMVQAYTGRQKVDLEPHLFAIAEEAYRCMLRDNKNQTIVVSGESGAGKTVSAKYVMRYFATVENELKTEQLGESEMSDTERMVLSTNPIMEAFGNAKTIRNDNSSRFGKYIEIQFDKGSNIAGARIRTYLLERSRLVYQPAGERNYHIFYQLLAGLSATQKMELELDQDPTNFFYLKQGGQEALTIDELDEPTEFEATKNAMKLIGIDDKKQSDIFKALAALLHLGNISITSAANKAVISTSDRSLKSACNLLGLIPEKFAKWCTRRQIVTRGESIESQLTEKQAYVVRDSVAKYIYVCLFEWLVEVMNNAMRVDESQIKGFIGVLDIYGFEYFQKNSFEQFCINYANEKLQQEFNLHVFKLEQEEYVKEGLNWSFIDYSDNQNCIDLIESRIGILSLLDEESRLPQGSDSSWIQKMHHNFYTAVKNKSYVIPRFGKSAFIIKHYALDVEYESEGFIEKNRDSVPDEHLNLLRSSSNDFVKQIVEHQIENSSRALEVTTVKRQIANANKKPTLGAIFRNSLSNLMETINSTNVHYIRCIKPNPNKAAWEFEPNMVLSQLRACGVLETIRISCAGFPTRMKFEECFNRYYMLLPSKQWTNSPKHFTANLIRDYALEENQYQIGLTKVFLRSGVLADLERLRTNRLNEAATVIQKCIRMYKSRTRYINFRRTLNFLQSTCRMKLLQKLLEEERKRRAAERMQSLLRGSITRRKCFYLRQTVQLLQNRIRGQTLRNYFYQMILNKYVIEIQRIWRYRMFSKWMAKQRHSAVVIQSCWRRREAQQVFKKIKAEKQSATHFKEISYQLERKVVELTQLLEQRIKENNKLNHKITGLQKGKKEAEERLLQTEQKIESLQKELEVSQTRVETAEKVAAQITELQNSRSSLKIKLKELQDSYSDLQQAFSDQKKELDVVSDKYEERSLELENLQGSMRELRETLQRDSNSVDNHFTLSEFRSEDFPRMNDLDLNHIGEREIDEVVSILYNWADLAKEFCHILIDQYHVPLQSGSSLPDKNAVLLPGRILIVIMRLMWQYSLYDAGKDFLSTIIPHIRSFVNKYEQDASIVPSIFWLSNIHELTSYVSNTIVKNTDTRKSNGIQELALVTRHELLTLENHLYSHWMIEVKKYLSKIVVPALIETQGLPGFTTTQGKGIFNKILSTTDPAQQMDNLINLFNKVDRAFKGYYMEQGVLRYAIDDLLHMVGVTAFNNMIMRTKFLSWKRGLQINYNITRIEEWCKLHEQSEGFLRLEHLLQATKLLQLKKVTIQDIEIIYDICWLLNPVQVQKLVAQYYVADYEVPVDPELIKYVSERVKHDTEKSALLLEAVPVDSCPPLPKVEYRHIDFSPKSLDSIPKSDSHIEKLVAASSRKFEGTQEV